jgi:bifunctional N-acetylglucosamine-1-phosphate-uridyltransferase/glucosamine-1-phosphate-acetyltransferase GlmU-like protein
MKGDLPKVVHPVGGRPMVCAVVDACRAAGCSRSSWWWGTSRLVRQAAGRHPEVEYAVQDQQLGTGHAVLCAATGRDLGKGPSDVIVLAGDGPLIRAQTIRMLLKKHRDATTARRWRLR